MNQLVLQDAFNRGVQAAHDGWEAFSPYHNHYAEAYWYLGYDMASKT